MEKENCYLFMKLIPECVRAMLEAEEKSGSLNGNQRKKREAKKIYSILDKRPVKLLFGPSKLNQPHHFRKWEGRFSECFEVKNVNPKERLVLSAYNTEDFDKQIRNVREKIDERMNLELIRRSIRQLNKMDARRVAFNSITSYNQTKHEATGSRQEVKPPIIPGNEKKFSIRRKESQYNDDASESSVTRSSVEKYTYC
eukprot:TRINITY_DN15195_c0_g2_i2.p1 TRINITY_DN15195_c0_g2~~TRINITY_DN15195_c0_g2_i2.p1  ORF type:complete len:198 (+),score=22.53 TRINITY_DN15195_c0_g2_i2:358-951(+)